MKLLRFLAVPLASLLSAVALLSQDDWEWRSPTPTGNRIGSYAYGNSIFVGVGENGAILTSANGTTWTNRESGVGDLLRRVIFDGTRFIAVGGTAILSSSDGSVWTKQTAPAALTDLVYGQGHYVAIAAPATTGGVHRFLTSVDGISWTLRDNGAVVDPAALAFSNGIFVAAGHLGQLLESSDTVSWTSTTIPGIAYDYLPYLVASPTQFLVTWRGNVYASTDGVIWTAVSSGPSLSFNGVLGYAGGYFLVDEGHYGRGISRSADGKTWIFSTPAGGVYQSFLIDFSTVAAGGGKFVGTETAQYIGYANPTGYSIHSSSDGFTWTGGSSETFPSSNATSSSDYDPIVYGLGRFFFSGYATSDGLTWIAGNFNATHAAGDRLFRLPALYLDSSTVQVSSDGLTSTTIDCGVPTPRSVAFGTGRYVIVGNGGKISTSADALTWSAAVSGSTSNLTATIFAFNRFIAVGESGTLLTSTDGLTWTRSSATIPTGLTPTSLVASPDRLVVFYGADTPGTVPPPTTLADGTPVDFAPYSAGIYFNGALVAYSYGLDDPNNPAYRTPHLWKSTDGITWTAIPIHVGATGYASFTPSLAAGNNNAFFVSRPGTPSSTTVYYALLRSLVSTPASPVIVAPPVGKTIARGETAEFSVGATGSDAFTYQWNHNGTAIVGATKALLTLKLVTDADAGDYTVTVTNSVGSATSAAGKLTVTAPVPLTITQQPVGGSLFEFQSLFLHVEVTGSGPYTYQWRRNSIPLADATSSATYEIWTSSSDIDNRTGTYDVVVSAPYSSATSNTAIVTRGAPSIKLNLSGVVTMTAGSTLTLTATAAGVAPFTYRWLMPGANNSLAGATGPTLILPDLTTDDSSPYTVEVTDANGQHAEASINLVVNASNSPPTSAAVTTAGQDLTLRSGLMFTSGYTFQWRHDGLAIAGATAASYTIHGFSVADEGSYDVVVTAPDGTISTRSEIELTLGGSRLVNLSARAFAGAGDDTLIQGFVLSGAPSSASPNVLVRSIGPTLAAMGVSGTLADPSIRVLDADRSVVAVNDNWSTVLTTGRGIAATSADMAQYGAFSLSTGSRDSAVLIHETLAGPYTALVSAIPSGTGIVLNEIYGPTSGSQRLVNLSARARVGTGDNILIAGFVITGSSPLKLLIRGVGPTLATQGISSPLANPKLTLFNSAGREIHNNDNWGQAANLADLRAATIAAGAFVLKDGSNDSAMLEMLDPGVYTAQVTSVDGTSGVALVEIYEAP